MRAASLTLAALAALPLAACATIRGSDGELAGRAMLTNSTGGPVGTAMLYRTGAGMRIEADVDDLPPGTHGFHLHTTGRCDAPGFQTAGGHLNPTENQHGFRNPEGPHLGDLPNMEVAANGTASYSAMLPNLDVMAEDALFDADGTAVMVHSGADDYISDPAGDAGSRIACGVLQRS